MMDTSAGGTLKNPSMFHQTFFLCIHQNVPIACLLPLVTTILTFIKKKLKSKVMNKAVFYLIANLKLRLLLLQIPPFKFKNRGILQS